MSVQYYTRNNVTFGVNVPDGYTPSDEELDGVFARAQHDKGVAVANAAIQNLTAPISQGGLGIPTQMNAAGQLNVAPTQLPGYVTGPERARLQNPGISYLARLAAQQPLTQNYANSFQSGSGLASRLFSSFITDNDPSQNNTNPILDVTGTSEMASMPGFAAHLGTGLTGFLTPENAMMMAALGPLGQFGKAAQLGIAGAFAAPMAKQAYETYQAGDPMGALGDMAAFAAPFALHGMGRLREAGEMRDYQARTAGLPVNGTLDALNPHGPVFSGEEARLDHLLPPAPAAETMGQETVGRRDPDCRQDL